MPYEVDLAFPFNDLTMWKARHEQCVSVVGFEPGSSGTGFGLRDMQFDFETRALADAALAALRTTNIPFEYLEVRRRRR
jgi:hypothetical protein